MLLLAIGVAASAALGLVVAAARPKAPQGPPPGDAASGARAPAPQQGGGPNPTEVLGGVTAAVGTIAAVGKIAGGLFAGGGTAAGVAAGSATVGVGAGTGTAAGGGTGAGATVGVTAGVSAGSIGAAAIPILIVVIYSVLVILATVVSIDRARDQAQFGGGINGIRKRFRSRLFLEEAYANEEVLIKYGKDFTRAGVTYAEFDGNRFDTRVARVTPIDAAALASTGLVAGKTSAFLTQRVADKRITAGDWDIVTSLHRYFAIEQLWAYNRVLFAYMLWRGFDPEREGVALSPENFSAFVTEWCELEPYAPELGYRCGRSYAALTDIAQANPGLLDARDYVHFLGAARAITFASVRGYQVTNPTAFDWVMTIRAACGMTDWHYLGTAGVAKNGGLLQHPRLPYAVDVWAGGKTGNTTIYDMRPRSAVPPDQVAAWQLSQINRELYA